MVFPGGRGRTAEEWEAELGRQARELRLQLNKSQLDVAEEAGISVSALQGLEGGHGSRLKTVIQVARVLGRADWLATFAPPTTVSPMEVLRARQREDEARRARARPKKTATS